MARCGMQYLLLQHGVLVYNLRARLGKLVERQDILMLDIRQILLIS